MTPIFIATKGRAGNSNIIKQIDNDKGNLFLFIEPQEIEIYERFYKNAKIINIEKNNNGLAYVRNFMLQYAIKEKLNLYWNLDDDVTLYKVENGKLLKENHNILYEAEKLFKDDETIAQASLEYCQFAWCSSNQLDYNRYCDCVVAIKPYLCKDLFFDEKAVLKLDRDFTIQVISSGLKTLKINKYAFKCPKNGSNKGGLFDVYKLGVEQANSEYMQNKWGENICLSIVKKDGRNDVRINWKNISSKQITLF